MYYQSLNSIKQSDNITLISFDNLPELGFVDTFLNKQHYTPHTFYITTTIGCES